MNVRTSLAVITLALASVHCGDDVELAPAPVATDDAPPPQTPAHPHAPAPIAEPADEGHLAPYDVGACNCALSAPVRGADGAYYTVGTFSGMLSLGEFELHSRGMNDIVLMKQDIGGHVVWALSAGSPYAERAARLSLQEDGAGSVTIVALTDGGADCGAGALPEWGDGSYFLCHYRMVDGVLLDGASFPRGS